MIKLRLKYFLYLIFFVGYLYFLFIVKLIRYALGMFVLISFILYDIFGVSGAKYTVATMV